jgi:hypothetical protein
MPTEPVARHTAITTAILEGQKAGIALNWIETFSRHKLLTTMLGYYDEHDRTGVQRTFGDAIAPRAHRRKLMNPHAKDAVIAVGDGRGFLIEHAPGPHRVITAAHCLPHLPPAHPWSYEQERSYLNLLGSLGGKPSIAAECLFVDPIADIAVLESYRGHRRAVNVSRCFVSS